ncbi:porin [Vibrio sp. ZSDE26]|uniref:Porin n=1 Tax=Vibrio amylolyticus TaxID=2847292 RepID=A0A9X1XIE1_9VIBR|nr:porin [Vibrio amylolyticus]MCK6262213.1 porin [Vibrio amylolyticus]
MDNKIFKRTLLGAAVSFAAVSGSANAAIELAGDAVQVYGQAAGFALLVDSGDTTSAGSVMESRIGFRGTVEFDDFAPNFIWQIEGGNADNSAKSGQLGARDTFIGLDFDGVGQFKFGRQLVAAYNYVDWPHTNPGLGNVFDWNNDIGASYQDRADSVFRYDSATWNGFNFQATLSGMGTDTDRLVSSLGTSFSRDMFSVHAGFYQQGSYDQGVDEPPKYIIDPTGNSATVVLNPAWTEWNNSGAKEIETVEKQSYGIVGGSLYLGDFTLTAALKKMKNGDADQTAVSTTAQYVIGGQWVLKAGYAQTDDATGLDNSGDTAITARLGYILPSAYLYLDSRNYKIKNDDNDYTADDWANSLLIGAEYYF